MAILRMLLYMYQIQLNKKTLKYLLDLLYFIFKYSGMIDIKNKWPFFVHHTLLMS